MWRAIATGPGLATWFVPAKVEEREGGSIVTHHGGAVTAVRAYLYGEGGADGVTRDEPRWEAWLEQRFPTFRKVGAPSATTQ